ncbi:uncharacterized protein BDV14DRAFT_203853 [Aspergillus stella-maris]|uniref:uncharacterized protein n=1 Tax=Aspergillus stella-maris TaxID=1810926 RepID=UPI003CCDAB48
MPITVGTPAETGTDEKRPSLLESLTDFKKHYEESPENMFENLKSIWDAKEYRLEGWEEITRTSTPDDTANHQPPKNPASRSEVAEIRQEIETLRNGLVELQIEGRRLRMDYTQHRLPDVDDLTDQVGELEGDVLALKRGLDMEQVQRTQNDKRQTGELEKAIDDFEEMFNLLEVKTDDLDAERMQRVAAVSELRDEVKQTCNKLEARIAILESQTENLEMKRENKTVEALQHRIDVEETCSKMQLELGEFAVEVVDSFRKVEELREFLIESHDQDRCEMSNLKADMKKMREKFSNMDAEIAKKDLAFECDMTTYVKKLISETISEELRKQQPAPDAKEPKPEAKPQRSNRSKRSRKKKSQNQSQRSILDDTVSEHAEGFALDFSLLDNPDDIPKGGAPVLAEDTAHSFKDFCITLEKQKAEEKHRKLSDSANDSSSDATFYDTKAVPDTSYPQGDTDNSRSRQKSPDEQRRDKIARIIRNARKISTKPHANTWRMPLTSIRDMKQGENLSDYLEVS